MSVTLNYKTKVVKKESSSFSKARDQYNPWTEQEENGTLYNTTLKKVRYRSHMSTDFDEPDVAFKQWETIKVRQMKAGTLSSLIEHLTPPNNDEDAYDPGFLLAFLCTYKSFAKSSEVINLLLKRFELFENNISSFGKSVTESVISRICTVFSVWVDKYPRDFDEPPSYIDLATIISFTSTRFQFPHLRELHERCKHKLTRLSVSPFDDEKPFKFKFCSCLCIVGCTCEIAGEIHCRINNFSKELIAQQLTLIDSELFLRVIPRESLAYFWSKRDPSKGSKAPSIKLTVDQFNAVSMKVISTILDAVDEKSRQHSTFARSKIMAKWIDVAMELRTMKNFSSLKAIISAFQCTSIYRLSCSWELIPKSSVSIYNDLSEIFSDEFNSKASRELLSQEGTAKYSTNSHGKAKSKRQSLMKEGVTNGTVPYLGTFLTDLMMIDSAFPDKIKGDLINFEKKRKEFEVVALIKMLQESAKNYMIMPNQDFFFWFNSLHSYNDKEGYNMSLKVEPPVPKLDKSGSPQMQLRRWHPERKLRRYLSENDVHCEKIDSASAQDVLSRYQLKISKSIIDLRDTTLLLQSKVAKNSLKVESLSSGDYLDSSVSTLDQAGVVGRVFLEDSIDVKYKSIKITPKHRACDVIRSTLQKFKSDENFSGYSLYQIIADKKSLHIPMNSNMFYAMCKSEELCFKVSKKKVKKKKTTKSSAITEDDISLKSYSFIS